MIDLNCPNCKTFCDVIEHVKWQQIDTPDLPGCQLNLLKLFYRTPSVTFLFFVHTYWFPTQVVFVTFLVACCIIHCKLWRVCEERWIKIRCVLVPNVPGSFEQDQSAMSNDTGTVTWTAPAPAAGTYDYNLLRDGNTSFYYEANPSTSFQFDGLSPASCITATIKSVFNCSDGNQLDSANVTTDLCTGKSVTLFFQYLELNWSL